ncbi:response regulator [uncultured Roseobacter sp.]|uniref:response regulator n=1 Tax=uncultured Roseobacter sp. TaxID=114847 RepID=UPI00262B7703|nr:response regulator [uncultured Roseobacter sp.]
MTGMTGEQEEAALKTCEAEQIRTPDRIQPHGFMCIFDEQLSKLLHVSANCTEFTGSAPEDLLGRPASDLMDEKGIHALRNALMLRSSRSQREFLGSQQVTGKKFLCAVHRSGELVILEATPQPAAENTGQGGLESLRWLMARQDREIPFSEGIDRIVKDLRSLIRFDRVMLYRFRPDGSGEVIAEDRTPDIQSYLGLRFPAQDVPRIARNICMEQPVRLIADLSSTDVELIAMPGVTDRPDLTLAELRGTSPVHIKYLQNMGVRSSLVLPVIFEDNLWGMFSCHHRKPRIHSIEETLNLELAGQILQVFVGNMLGHEREARLAYYQTLTAGFGEQKSTGFDDLLDRRDWSAFAPQLCKELRVDGLSLGSDTKRLEYGIQPDRQAELHYDRDLAATQVADVECSSNLTPVNGAAGDQEIAGMMRIRFFSGSDLFLRLYRREENETVRWAGAPDKTIEHTGTETRLLPRSSFEEYREKAKGHSRAWEPDDIMVAEVLRTCLGRAIETRRERLDRENNFQLVIHELNHRVRNVLSLIQSVIRQTSRLPTSVPEYAHALENRVLAVARAHDLLTASDGGVIPVSDVIEKEFAAFPAHQYRTDGTDVFLDKDTATVFVLVVHEMVTNAAKHGALSVPQGLVTVCWFQRGDRLHLSWRETDGPRVDNVATAGFGQFLIQQAINDRLDGRTVIDNHPDGVTMDLVLPGAISERDVGKNTLIHTPVREAEPAAANLVLDHVLIVEDNPLIGAEIRFALIDAGIPVVSYASRVDKALSVIQEAQVSVAILDVNLGIETSEVVARELLRADIPFVFLTGYAENYDWLSEFREVPVLTKPVDYSHLVSVLSQRSSDRPPEKSDTKRILLVEDNVPLQQEIVEVLEKEGHRVTVATDADEAIALSQSEAFDGIILDMFLSYDDTGQYRGSLTLIAGVKRMSPGKRRNNVPVPVLAISGGAEVKGGYSPLRTARDLGADDWLRKPVREADLINWVRKLPRRP